MGLQGTRRRGGGGPGIKAETGRLELLQTAGIGRADGFGCAGSGGLPKGSSGEGWLR